MIVVLEYLQIVFNKFIGVVQSLYVTIIAGYPFVLLPSVLFLVVTDLIHVCLRLIGLYIDFMLSFRVVGNLVILKRLALKDRVSH